MILKYFIYFDNYLIKKHIYGNNIVFNPLSHFEFLFYLKLIITYKYCFQNMILDERCLY